MESSSFRFSNTLFVPGVIFSQPQVCDMASFGCSQLIGLWSPGINGQCLPQEYGFRIGPHGYRYAVLQVVNTLDAL